MKVHEDFKDFIDALNKNNVEYVIVGAFALAFHGHPRATGDIDIWLRPKPFTLSLTPYALCSSLGWQANISLKERLKQTYRWWYLENSNKGLRSQYIESPPQS
jgi:nucleoside-diphosphate-sugar epimerase